MPIRSQRLAALALSAAALMTLTACAHSRDTTPAYTGEIDAPAEVVLASDPDTVEAGPWVMRLENATYDAVSVTGEINFEGVERTRSTNHSFTAFNFPGLF